MVSKEELFAKYKELKAKGVQVSLVELKKQLEGGVNDVTNRYGTSQTTVSSGENAATNQYGTSQATVPSGVNAATNQYGTSQAAVSSGVNNATNQYETVERTSYVAKKDFQASSPSFPNSNFNQGDNISQKDTWTTYTLNQASSPASYSGNLSNVAPVENNSYVNNFSGSFSFGENSQSQVSLMQEQEKVPYTGNISQNQVLSVENQNKKYCLIGYPLGHSLSSYIHEAGFKSLNIDTTYEILETPPDTLVDRIKYLKCNNYAGFNITIPLKLPITVFLDEIDSSADTVGAVNTVVINPDKTMKGYNTDVIGFRNAIPSDFILTGKVAGVLGTGGAARAAITALAQAQIKQIKIYTRNIPNSLKLLNFVRKEFPNVEFNAFQIEWIRDLSDVDILVNTTPIGMLNHSADMTPVEENELKTLPQGALVYDVIYNPKKTVLIKLAQKNGYKTINGIDMLIHQALAAEQIWTGKTPDFKDMKIAALENL
jgi:shikimate dehydrogenase